MLVVHDLQGDVQVTVTVYDFPAKKQVLFSDNTLLNGANGYLSNVTIKVGAHWSPAPLMPRPALDLLPIGIPPLMSPFSSLAPSPL